MESSMVQQLIVSLPNLGVALFMLYHFMKRDEQKEAQNQANLGKFIEIQKETVIVFGEANKIQATSIEVLREVGEQVKNMETYMRDGKICKRN